MTKKNPIGDQIRNFINPALEDSRKQQIQLELLNMYFEQMAIKVAAILETPFKEIFNAFAQMPPETDKNKILIQQLTWIDAKTGRPGYSPIFTMAIPIFPPFTEFTWPEIRELPGYIMFHEALRAENAAVSIRGLTTADSDGRRNLSPPLLTIDATKTYEQGLQENLDMYPELPPLPQPFDRETHKKFKFGE